MLPFSHGLFRDIIFRRTRHFPILNFSARKQRARQRFPLPSNLSSLHGIDPSEPRRYLNSGDERPRFASGEPPSVVFDEYKNDLDVAQDSLPQRWCGVAAVQTQKNQQLRRKWRRRPSCRPALRCAPGPKAPHRTWRYYATDIPRFSPNRFTQEETQENTRNLSRALQYGLTHLAVEILSPASAVRRRIFPQAYSLTKSSFAARVKTSSYTTRIFRQMGDTARPTFPALETSRRCFSARRTCSL